MYIGAVWALAQGIAQLGPFFNAPDWIVRWFVIACSVGFPFWVAFAWYYAWTPEGFKREREVLPEASIARSTGRKLDFWIIGVLVVAVVLLGTNTFVLHRDATSRENATEAKAVLATLAKAPQKSVAVLPFANDSGDQNQRYFSDGLSDDLITALSQLSGLKVSSRQASTRFRNSTQSSAAIAATLGVTHLVEGSVQRAGNEVRINVELVNASDGITAWSQHYDKPFKDLFKLQDSVTHDVAEALQTRLAMAPGAVAQTDRPPSGNLEAYMEFLRGRSYYHQAQDADLYQAVAAHEAAIRLDTHYAAAYAALSTDWSVLGEEFLDGAKMKQAYADALQAANTAIALDPDEEFLDGAKMKQAYADALQAANTAIALDPDLADGHVARAEALLRSQLDWKDAKVEMARAKRLDPSSFAANAQTGNPQNAGYWFRRSSRLADAGDLDGAEKGLRMGIVMRPKWWVGYMMLNMLEVRRGDAKAAMAAAQHVPKGVWHIFAVALASQIGGDRTAANAALQQLVDYKNGFAAYQLAEVYALRKGPDDMFKWLEHAWAIRDPGLQGLPDDAFFNPYHHDPRFAAFIRKIGLPATGATSPEDAAPGNQRTGAEGHAARHGGSL